MLPGLGDFLEEVLFAELQWEAADKLARQCNEVGCKAGPRLGSTLTTKVVVASSTKTTALPPLRQQKRFPEPRGRWGGGATTEEVSQRWRWWLQPEPLGYNNRDNNNRGFSAAAMATAQLQPCWEPTRGWQLQQEQQHPWLRAGTSTPLSAARVLHS